MLKMPHDCALGHIPDGTSPERGLSGLSWFLLYPGSLGSQQQPRIQHQAFCLQEHVVFCFVVFCGDTARTSQIKSGQCFRLCKRLGNCSHISFTSSSCFLEITDFHSVLQPHVNQFDRNVGQIKNPTSGSSPVTFLGFVRTALLSIFRIKLKYSRFKSIHPQFFLFYIFHGF